MLRSDPATAGVVPSATNPVMNFLRFILRLSLFGRGAPRLKPNHSPNRPES
jgi:hypothetical protein